MKNPTDPEELANIFNKKNIKNTWMILYSI